VIYDHSVMKSLPKGVKEVRRRRESFENELSEGFATPSQPAG